MDKVTRNQIRNTVLETRRLLEADVAEQLEGIYGIARSGKTQPPKSMPTLQADPVLRRRREQIEAALSYDRDAGLSPQEAVAHVGEELAMLESLINDLNLLAQAEAGDLPLNLQLEDLGALVEGTVQRWQGRAGARGLMQITPDAADTIERLSGATSFELDDLSDPEINIRYGTFLLKELLERYDGDEAAALAGYNAGPGNADEWGGSGLSVEEIPFPETRAYVEEVLEKQREYRQEYAKQLGYR